MSDKFLCLKNVYMKKIVIHLLLMLSVIVAIAFFVLRYIDTYTHHKEKIAVPDLTGMQLDDAVELLRRNKLDFDIVDYKYKEGAKSDEVLEQRPRANANVKSGRKILLTMSSVHEPTLPVPAIIDNCSLREAEARLRASGFVLAPPKEVPGEKDWVYGLMCGNDTLSNGTPIAMGATVTLLVGSGEEAQSDEPIIDNSWFE